MKSSDLKVVAIILSIALFFTILTSNAVSIASVVLLAKGGTGAPVQTVAPQGGTPTTPSGSTSTTPSGSTSTTPSGSTSTTPDANAQTPAGDQGGATAQTPAGNTGTQAPAGNTGTQAPAGNQGGAAADANDPVMKDPLAFYQKAAKDIATKGSAGYNKIGWQKILKIEGLGILDGAITGIIGNFMTDESEAEVKQNAKGSDDAKNRMPISDCNKNFVKSATAEKLGNGNYKVVIVLNATKNPSYDDADGLVKMSREFLDMKDVMKEAANISIVKSLDGEINYVDYTITAEMTKDGKFVSITHWGVGYIKANLNGSINASGELEFNAKYTDFQY